MLNIPASEGGVIGDAMIKAWWRLSQYEPSKVCVSVSGGSDSDIMLDMVYRCLGAQAHYVWFDTGLEYQATKEHLLHIESKYGIRIERVKALKSIPTAVREYGQPFLSKYVSEAVSALQRCGFSWTDEPYDVLVKRYPGAASYLRWWCNIGKMGMWRIDYNKGLKEFMLRHPPTFPVSNRCCFWAKKAPQKQLIRERGFALKCVGIRRAEGGIRSTVYKSCFDSETHIDNFRPVFWFTGEDKKVYEEHYGVTHSRCYTEYGMCRTGCAGCPYNRNLDADLRTIELYEPKLYVACCNVFKDTYDYTAKYRAFRASL
jgi:3'-phosphoadenosine 5'-phosphosulfate sulfotransferase (PAPS reductase)/FAD synthetase